MIVILLCFTVQDSTATSATTVVITLSAGPSIDSISVIAGSCISGVVAVVVIATTISIVVCYLMGK